MGIHGNELLSKYVSELEKIVNDNKAIYVMLWAKANPHKDIEDYAFCYRTHYIDGEAFQTFCMRKVSDIYEQGEHS